MTYTIASSEFTFETTDERSLRAGERAALQRLTYEIKLFGTKVATGVVCVAW
jgi:hypothetical protein